mgnify:CR=1 FL=1
MSHKNYYIMDFLPDGLGVPYFLDKHWSPELPTFDIFSSPPDESLFDDIYKVRILADFMDGDYFPDDNLVSGDMLLLLEKYKVNFFSREVDITLSKKNKPKKKYNLFFLKDYIYLLNKDESDFVLSDDLSCGVDESKKSDAPQEVFYDVIERFVVKDNVGSDLFFCKEISKPVCSEGFKEEYTALNMKGVKFIPIDEKYKFDPWGGF